MKQNTIIYRDKLPKGGFAGVRETRVVVPPMMSASTAASQGLGTFIYLADAEFIPNGETGLHPHRDVDIVSIMVRGRIEHQGSLEHGTMLDAGVVQVQRSGTGMMHNEVNPDAETNRMLQLWFLPPQRGLAPGYKVYIPEPGKFVTALGGEGAFDNESRLEVGIMNSGETVTRHGTLIAYVATGKGSVGDTEVHEGALVEAEGLEYTATEQTLLIVVTDKTSEHR